MSARLNAWRSRARPVFTTAVSLAALAAGAGLVLAPAALLGGVWPPLHARCIGVMALSLATALESARRALDPAAQRMPLLVLAVWVLSSAALAWAGSRGSWLLTSGLAAVGGAALVLARVDSDPPAPAQHADKSWLGIALLAVLVALLLLVGPHSVAPYWPWRLPAPFVAQYAPLFLAWGVAAWLVSRERRRYMRVPVLAGLLTWAVGVLLASWWHAAAFQWANPLAAVWIAAFVAVAALAAHRLWPAWSQRLRRTLGPGPHDGGTVPPRQ